MIDLSKDLVGDGVGRVWGVDLYLVQEEIVSE